MKVTVEIPDGLYREVKAKSALEGRAIREVAAELFRRYVEEEGTSVATEVDSDDLPRPAWFGVLREEARRVQNHDLEAIRESIARGLSRERDL